MAGKDLARMTHFQYLEDVDAVLGVIEGDLSFQKYKESVSDLMTYSQYKPGRNVIWDLRGASSKSLTSEHIRSVASYAKTLDGARGKWKAVLVVPNLVELGLARMFEAWLDDAPFSLKICYTLEEAKAWVRSGDQTGGN